MQGKDMRERDSDEEGKVLEEEDVVGICEKTRAEDASNDPPDLPSSSGTLEAAKHNPTNQRTWTKIPSFLGVRKAQGRTSVGEAGYAI